MININLSVEKFILTVTGHAQPDECEQYREVCAASSMLVQGLAYSITKFQDAQNGIQEIDYRNQPGDMLLRIKPDPWAEATVRKRMRAYGDGLELLAQSEPQSVSMTWDGIPVKPEEGEKGNE